MGNETRFESFGVAARRTLSHLRERHGLDAWMITRLRDDDLVIVEIDDRAFGLARGDVVNWRDSVCFRMTRGGPNVVARCSELDVYAEAPIRDRLGIESYVGFPLRARDGRILGTLCGIGRSPLQGWEESDSETLELFAGLLGQLLEHEIEHARLARRNERFRYEAMTDALTHLPNRRAWQEKIETEQERAERLGEATFITIVDLDSLKKINDQDGHAAGDELLRNAALVLRYAVRDSDFVARIGGDEFAVLGLQCGTVEADDVSARIREALGRSGISASVGTMMAQPTDRYEEVWSAADRLMYREKRSPERDSRRMH
ncbi:MAG: GGDEF domain-containing protein [Candidatus Wenzhouxiangella sp. M2_3B_020]